MAEEAPAGTYVKDCVIRDSLFRCITIHGTDNVLVHGNVAYNNLGHCIYLEDGSEQDNIISRYGHKSSPMS
jgi:parallel beta-helix repeat protein